MLLTDCGIDQLEFWRNRIATRFSEFVLGHPAETNESYQAAWDGDDLDGGARTDVRSPEPDLLRFRPRLRIPSSRLDLARHEQRARVLALRGLSQARDGEYERAQTTFASAARLDPGLDLALLPSFWGLPRRAHDVAVAALRDADRDRDAAALTAAIKSRFRPRPVRAINRHNDSIGD